ncbi:MAG: hypothetical protein M1839_003581 [Geoglossum umbratile]|nr:MAG: hypothetical protein M1839_003581 [Geoglossum umbratile]
MSSHQPQIPIIYMAAIGRFEEITGKNLNDPDLLRITTVDDLIKEVDKRNTKFTSFREKRHTLFDVLEGAMKPIELVGNLAAGAASMAFPPSSLVFGAAMYLIGAAKGTTACYDSIQALMVTLKDFTTRLSIYAREEISKELSEKLTEVLAALIEAFALSRKAIKEGRMLKFAKNVLLGNDDRVTEAVGKLANLTESEDRLVGADTLTEAKRTGRIVDGVSMTVRQTNVSVREMGMTVSHVDIGVTELNEKVTNIMLAMDESKAVAKEEKDKKHQDNVKKVLQPSVRAQDWYDKINKSRVPGTGDWVRDEGLFKSWVDKTFPVLWISGTPGAGKSYLSSNIITFLREQHPQSIQHPSHTSVAYYFFKDDNPKTRSFSQALRDIAYQICQNDPVYAKHVTTQCDSPAEIDSIESIWRCFFKGFFLQENGLDSSAYILFDGIDEAYDAERQTFLQLIKDLNEGIGRSGMQLVMVGRPHLTDVISDAYEAEVPTIHVTSVKNSDDIVHYIQNSIHKSAMLKRVPKELRAEIVDKLSSGAQGMFLWVDLMLKELMKKRTPASLRKSLQEAPKGISEMLRHVLEGFSLSLTDEDPGCLNELLAWATCARSPLKLGELDALLKLRSEDGEGMFYLEGMLRKQYASFFSLIREDGLSTADLQNPHEMPADSDGDQEAEEEGLDDIENTTDFHSNPSTTEVTLCHASIGDFFRDQTKGKVSAGDGYPMIGVNFDEAEVSVLKTCLSLFCDEKLAEKAKVSPSLMRYPTNNWQHHLRTADPAKASPTDRREIVGLLASMFRSELSMKSFAGNITWAFFVEDNVKMIRRWLDYPDIQDDLSTEDREWIRSTSEAPADTFLPLVRYVAQRWLQDIWWSPTACCWIVYAFINLQKGAPLSESPSGLITAQEVLDVAEWAQFEKTALWHRKLAIVFRDRAMYDDALAHFAKALEMDDTMSSARAGMAVLYVLKDEYEEAIRLDKINEEILQKILVAEPSRPQIKPELHLVQERLGRCHLFIRDKEAALERYLKALSSNGRCEDCICACLVLLTKRERHQDIVDILKGMEDEIPGQGYSRLTEFLWQNIYADALIFTILAHASLETKELTFLIGAYRSAIAAAKKELKMVIASSLELCLARLYYIYGRDQERAIHIWEKITKTFSGSKLETEMGYVKDYASVCLAGHWLRMALDTEKGSPLAQRCVDKLERLAKPKMQTAGPSSAFISTNTSSIILGSWYHLNKQPEDARACFQPHIREALQMLSDDDPENDGEGYFKLGLVFAAAGDDKNAIAIFQALGVWDKAQLDEPPSGENGAEASDSDDPDSDSDDESYDCDGPCHRTFRNLDSLALCRYCHDTGFCAECLPLVKAGRMPLNTCSPKHDWLVIPPLERPVGVGNLLVDGQVVGLDDWKKSVKREWGV